MVYKGKKKKQKKTKDKAVKTVFPSAAGMGGSPLPGQPRSAPKEGYASKAPHPPAGGTSGTAVTLSQLALTRDFSDVYWAEIMLLRLNILNELQQISPRSLVTWALLKGSYGSY